MKHYLSAVAAAAMFGLVSTPAFGQTVVESTCTKSEGMVNEYDFPVGYSGILTLRDKNHLYMSEIRLASSSCVEGSVSKVMFRGVNHVFKDKSEVEKALDASALLVEIGLTDPAAIKQLIDRTAAVKAAEDQLQQKANAEKKPVADKKALEPQVFPWSPPKKK